MTPLSKKFHRAYAKTLFKIAEGDLATAEILLAHSGGRPENTFYLCQQAIEKTLKAVLCHHGFAIPMTHDIGALLAALPEGISRPPEETSLLGLTEFAMTRRYEEGLYEYTPEEMRAAVGATEKLVSWAGAVLIKDSK